MIATEIVSPWLTVAEAAVYARCHENRIRLAVTSGECVGHQPSRQGKWRIHRDDLDRWIRGEIPKAALPTPLTRRRVAS